MIKKTILLITLILLTSIVNAELSHFKKLGEAPAQQLGPKKLSSEYRLTRFMRAVFSYLTK